MKVLGAMLLRLVIWEFYGAKGKKYTLASTCGLRIGILIRYEFPSWSARLL